ncbi:MAG TPA: Crp/Fnr family transcriptional regulator, partial [Chloroflexota bacterium]|nr:Crp/Fnr family transcriptional regulator [Chloroflexota bacterium]
MTPDTRGTLLHEIERRAAHVAIKIRQALAAFLTSEADTARAMSHAEALAAEQERGYRPSLWEIERYAVAWRDLVPGDAAGKAQLAAALLERHPFRPQDAPATAAALHLDDPAVQAAHAALFGEPLERRYATQTQLHDERHAVAFDGWNERALGVLLREVEWVRLDKGEILFRRGEPGDGLYIVVSGHLRAFVEGAGGRDALVGEMGHGESVGEMGLISGAAHSATLYASRDTELVKLTPHLFHRMVREHPEFLLHVTREVVDRLRASHRGRRAGAPLRAIAVLPAGGGAEPAGSARPDLGAFCARLAQALGAFGAVRHVSRRTVDSRLGDGTAAGLDHDPHDPRLLEWLDALESEHDLMLYEADAAPSGWTDRCAHESDYLLFVASASDEAGLNAIERALP